MTDSLADWLTLRAAADTAARSQRLVDALVAALPSRRPLRLVDLGTGTGSNVRYLAPRLPSPQEWRVVDRDPGLLSHIHPPMPNCSIEAREWNLGDLRQDLLSDRDVVTASALLDLVSTAWIARLAEYCRRAGVSALFALTYDGRTTCNPPEPEDGLVLDLFNRHQRHSDKGFGRAAGPDAVTAAAQAFGVEGFVVTRARSDWDLPPSTAAMQRYLIEGWADASSEIAPERRPAIDAWKARRLAHVDAGRSHISVGHEDLLAIPRVI